MRIRLAAHAPSAVIADKARAARRGKRPHADPSRVGPYSPIVSERVRKAAREGRGKLAPGPYLAPPGLA